MSANFDHDPETGEVREPLPRRGRRKRELTPEARAVVEERKAQRARLLRAVEALSPALVVEGDPPLRETGAPLIDVSRAREVTPLLRIPRASGTGGPGSALVATVREYDGGNGGEATSYVLLHAEFSDGGGFRCRTRGVAVRAHELREVVGALLECATALDERNAPVPT